MLSFWGTPSNQDHNTPAGVTEEGEHSEPQQNSPEEEVEQPQEPPAEPHPEQEPELEPKSEPVPEQEPHPEAEQELHPEGEPFASSSYQAPHQPQDTQGGQNADPTVIVGSPPIEAFGEQDAISPSSPQVANRSAFTQTSQVTAVEIMAASVNQTDNTLNATNPGLIPNPPTSPGNDGIDNSANPNVTGSTSNDPSSSPVMRVRTRGTRPRVALLPNPNLAATSNANLRPSRSQMQMVSRSAPPPRRWSTGPGLVMHDSVEGDVGYHQVCFPSLGDEGVPIRRGNGGTGRVGVRVPQPRLAFSSVHRTMVENGHPPRPGPSRSSRLMFIKEDMSPREETVQERLRSTVDIATTERDEYRRQAKRQRITINGVIALQLTFSALITGIAAGLKGTGPGMIALGVALMIIALHLAQIRGSGEPEFSSTRMKELSSFLREIHAFIADHGEKPGAEHGEGIAIFREWFEAIFRTEKEESGSGGHQSHPAPCLPPPVHVADGRPGGMDEKQMMRRNGNAIDSIV